MRKLSTILFLLLFIHVRAGAQSWQDTTRIIDRLFERYHPTNPVPRLEDALKMVPPQFCMDLPFNHPWYIALRD